MCNDEFELLDWSYSPADIQDYFKYIIKKHAVVSDNPLIKIYKHKIENRLHLGQNIIPNFWHMNQWNYLKVPKVKMVKMYVI